LPIKKSAYKELEKSKKRHLRNISAKSELKTLVKKFEKLLSDKSPGEAKKDISYLVSKMNKAASKGIIKKNTASRKISRLMRKLFLASPKT